MAIAALLQTTCYVLQSSAGCRDTRSCVSGHSSSNHAACPSAFAWLAVHPCTAWFRGMEVRV